MIWRFIVRPEAERDLSEAHEWYEAQVPGLGAQFVAEFERSLESIQQFSEKQAAIYRDVRRALTHRFPYLVFLRDPRGHNVRPGSLTRFTRPANLASSCP